MPPPDFLKCVIQAVPECFPANQSIGISVALHHTVISPAD